jgi:hypothetical protein
MQIQLHPNLFVLLVQPSNAHICFRQMTRTFLFLHFAKCIILFVYYLGSADYVSPQFLACPAILKIVSIPLFYSPMLWLCNELCVPFVCVSSSPLALGCPAVLVTFSSYGCLRSNRLMCFPCDVIDVCNPSVGHLADPVLRQPLTFVCPAVLSVYVSALLVSPTPRAFNCFLPYTIENAFYQNREWTHKCTFLFCYQIMYIISPTHSRTVCSSAYRYSVEHGGENRMKPGLRKCECWLLWRIWLRISLNSS